MFHDCFSGLCLFWNKKQNILLKYVVFLKLICYTKLISTATALSPLVLNTKFKICEPLMQSVVAHLNFIHECKEENKLSCFSNCFPNLQRANYKLNYLKIKRAVAVTCRKKYC